MRQDGCFAVPVRVGFVGLCVEDCGAERGVYAVVWVTGDGECGRVVHAVEG